MKKMVESLPDNKDIHPCAKNDRQSHFGTLTIQTLHSAILPSWLLFPKSVYETRKKIIQVVNYSSWKEDFSLTSIKMRFENGDVE